MKKHIFTIGLSALLLSACQTIDYEKEIRKAPEPVVSKAETRIDIDFEYNRKSLHRDEKAKIENFIMKYEVSNLDDIVITIAQQGGELAKQRGERVAAYFKRFGLKPQFNWTDKAKNLQKVQVSLGRYSISVKGCPDWSDHPGQTFGNQVSSNFGCANASNLSLMIGDPRDLIRGRDSSYVDGAKASAAVQSYRKGKAQQSDNSSSAILKLLTGDKDE